MQIYAAQPVIYSANESLNTISSDRVLLFTFSPIARKLYFNPNPLQGTEENCQRLLIVSTLCHICIIA